MKLSRFIMGLAPALAVAALIGFAAPTLSRADDAAPAAAAAASASAASSADIAYEWSRYRLPALPGDGQPRSVLVRTRVGGRFAPMPRDAPR